MNNAGVLEGLMPEMPVRDVRSAVEFYRDVLGFSVDYMYGDSPVYAIVKRDNVRLALLEARNSDPGDGRCYIFVREIDAYYQAVKRGDPDIIDALANRPYGMKDFALRDLDGNRLAFGQAIAAAAQPMNEASE
jgi:catechol 2,3-dioxygenase-like lactoylglutathione lyase family enzyme